LTAAGGVIIGAAIAQGFTISIALALAIGIICTTDSRAGEALRRVILTTIAVNVAFIVTLAVGLGAVPASKSTRCTALIVDV